MKLGSIIVFSGLMLAGLLMAGWVYAEIDPETVVAVWLLDEGQGKIAGDLSENANDGNITGSEWVDGKFGKALGRKRQRFGVLMLYYEAILIYP